MCIVLVVLDVLSKPIKDCVLTKVLKFMVIFNVNHGDVATSSFNNAVDAMFLPRQA